MLASFSIVPLDVGYEFKAHIARIISIVEASGLSYRLGPMETTVEGDWDELISLIKKCHYLMREISPRVLTHISIDDRQEISERLAGKVREVEKILGKEVSHDGSYRR